MATVPQGKKAVANAGTKVQLQVVPEGMNGILLQADVSNTQNIYVGDSTLVAGTRVGVMKVLTPGETFFIGGKYLQTGNSNEDPSSIWLDADVNGEFVLWSKVQ